MCRSSIEDSTPHVSKGTIRLANGGQLRTLQAACVRVASQLCKLNAYCEACRSHSNYWQALIDSAQPKRLLLWLSMQATVTLLARRQYLTTPATTLSMQAVIMSRGLKQSQLLTCHAPMFLRYAGVAILWQLPLRNACAARVCIHPR